VAALDEILHRLKSQKVDFQSIIAVSGSGQQHGSTYWVKNARARLTHLDCAKSLESQLSNAFSIPESPIWMDSSTSQQCAELEKLVGGAQAMATLTGSRCYERFTANQILKRVQQESAAINKTERISLISSMMCSLLMGDYAPIDTSDGAGMNLLNLQKEAWEPKIANYIHPDLVNKLGTPVPAYHVIGTISHYFLDRYGFNHSCRVVAWSGDNPCSLAGLGLKSPGDVGISLGTSDTIFSIVDKRDSKPGIEGHFFPNPVDPTSHMTMLCYKNGSLSRQKVAKTVADGNWDLYNSMVQKSPAGNNGYIGFYIDRPEIIPHIAKTGIRRFDAKNYALAGPFPEKHTEARAVLEGQFLSMRLHGENLGMKPTSIIVTGGASQNKAICQVLADVFGCTVKAASQPDSASLGAAYRAKHALVCQQSGEFVPYTQALGQDPAAAHHVVAESNAAVKPIYNDMLKRYCELEQRVVKD